GIIFNPNGRINNQIANNTISATRSAPAEGGDAIKLQNLSNQNVITGNKLGTNAAGTAALGNQRWGIFIQTACSGNVISSNLISGNGQEGVSIRDAGTS